MFAVVIPMRNWNCAAQHSKSIPPRPCRVRGMLAQGEVRQLEEATAVYFPEALAVIGAERMNAERRPARLRVRDFAYEFDGDSLRLRFALSAGSFATTVLRELFINDTGE